MSSSAPFLALSMAAAFAGCAGSPQEEPESVTDAFPFDPDRMEVIEEGAAVRWIGGAGSVIDATEVWGGSLTSPSFAAPTLAPVTAEGSFELVTAGAIGDRFRLHARTSFGVEPVDFTVDGGVPVPNRDCIAGLSSTEYRDLGTAAIDEPSVATIELINLCDVPIAITGTRALSGSPEFSLDLAGLAALEPTQTATVEVSFTPTSVGERFDYLVIDVDEHPPFVLTVRGRGE